MLLYVVPQYNIYNKIIYNEWNWLTHRSCLLRLGKFIYELVCHIYMELRINNCIFICWYFIGLYNMMPENFGGNCITAPCKTSERQRKPNFSTETGELTLILDTTVVNRLLYNIVINICVRRQWSTQTSNISDIERVVTAVANLYPLKQIAKTES